MLINTISGCFHILYRIEKSLGENTQKLIIFWSVYVMFVMFNNDIPSWKVYALNHIYVEVGFSWLSVIELIWIYSFYFEIWGKSTYANRVLWLLLLLLMVTAGGV